jgi:hypothetical protein
MTTLHVVAEALYVTVTVSAPLPATFFAKKICELTPDVD